MDGNILGKRIAMLREEKDLKQLELAKILNICNTTLSQYESGKRIPSDEIKNQIADYFDVTIDFLLGRTMIRNPYKSSDEEIDLIKEDHCDIDIHGLPEEAVKRIEEYIEFIKQKYNRNKI